jgi:uncharacterized protein (DUF4213/DUF364 family)
MKLDRKLFEIFEQRAREVRVETVSLGLGYTAVTTSDGGIGMAYTYFNNKQSCFVLQKGYTDLEGGAAEGLLRGILESQTVRRSVALATVNALNHAFARSLPEDPGEDALFDQLAISAGTRVAMVGYFGPLVERLKALRVTLEVIDESRAMGDPQAFMERLGGWAEALILTSTAILNRTAEDILGHVSNAVPCVMLGPSTPMVPAAFTHLPVHQLAGMVPLDREGVLKAVRHGLGTPALKKFSRKCRLAL